jgi:hypothetical protein
MEMECTFVLLIMNCKKYANKAEIQRNTWIKQLPPYLKYYHVIGDETLHSDYEFNNETHMLNVKTPDDYNSLPKKVINAYNAVIQTFPDIQYIFKTDDDQDLKDIRFFDIVTKTLSMNMNDEKKYHYGGFLVDVPKPYLSQYHKIHPELPQYLPIYATKYCSGRFYFLSKEALIQLIKKKEEISKLFLEDYAVGFFLDEKFKQNILRLQTQKYFVDIM